MHKYDRGIIVGQLDSNKLNYLIALSEQDVLSQSFCHHCFIAAISSWVHFVARHFVNGSGHEVPACYL